MLSVERVSLIIRKILSSRYTPAKRRHKQSSTDALVFMYKILLLSTTYDFPAFCTKNRERKDGKSEHSLDLLVVLLKLSRVDGSILCSQHTIAFSVFKGKGIAQTNMLLDKTSSRLNQKSEWNWSGKLKNCKTLKWLNPIHFVPKIHKNHSTVKRKEFLVIWKNKATTKNVWIIRVKKKQPKGARILILAEYKWWISSKKFLSLCNWISL